MESRLLANDLGHDLVDLRPISVVYAQSQAGAYLPKIMCTQFQMCIAKFGPNWSNIELLSVRSYKNTSSIQLWLLGVCLCGLGWGESGQVVGRELGWWGWNYSLCCMFRVLGYWRSKPGLLHLWEIQALVDLLGQTPLLFTICRLSTFASHPF